MTAPTDAPEALRDAVAGDTAAFGTLYTQYQKTVFRFILGKVRHTPLAEDLTADVFMKAFKSIRTFEWQGTNVLAWLLAIARNRVADHWRSGYARRECIELGDDPELDKVVDLSVEGLPEEFVAAHVDNARVLKALNGLPYKQRDVLILRFLHDLTLLETADVLGFTEPQVKALQFRAVRALARLVPEGWQR